MVWSGEIALLAYKSPYLLHALSPRMPRSHRLGGGVGGRVFLAREIREEEMGRKRSAVDGSSTSGRGGLDVIAWHISLVGKTLEPCLGDLH